MNLRSLLLCTILLVFGISWAVAQDSDSKAKSDTRTITGCLAQQSDNSNSYELRASDGSTWELTGDGIDFAKHVGHTVSATGVVRNNTMHNLKEDTKGMAHDTGMKKDNSEHGHLTVTDLQHVSETCQK